MKKIIVLLSVTVLLLTGCSVYRLDSKDFEKNVDYLLSKNSKLYNVYYDGYKYYLPKGISFVSKDEYNALLMDQNQNEYYLYVDAISYYHKVKNDYEVNESSYYSDYIDYRHKNGYLQIDKDEGKYFIQFVYNYVKIEAYVPEEDLVDSITNMCYILRSVKFNDSVLSSLIGENVLNYQEEDYNLFKADSSKESYMDVAKRNENEDYSKYLEDEKINLDY
ncbi:MAG: hypothetical protein IKF71_05270 [Bacilli bacterium]|nr:hypothetical protein [Bacilli bacterium]